MMPGLGLLLSPEASQQTSRATSGGMVVMTLINICRTDTFVMLILISEFLNSLYALILQDSVKLQYDIGAW